MNGGRSISQRIGSSKLHVPIILRPSLSMAPVGPVQTYAKLENKDSSREHPDHFRLDTSSISNPPNPSLYSKP